MRTLCGGHNQHGAEYNAGLGFYAYLRFHVDSTKYRRWNMDPTVAAECPPIVHPEDVASVGQPIPAQATPAGPTTAPATPTLVPAPTTISPAPPGAAPPASATPPPTTEKTPERGQPN